MNNPKQNNVGVSSLMSRLNQEATKKARNMVASRFTDAVDLEEIGTLISQIKKQMELSESQLNVAVQSKLDALKRAADIMDESSIKLSHLSTSLRSIDERIAETNTVISNYEYLRRVHHARDNISKVISRVEFFARVPEKVRNLNDILESDPSQLKNVYLEAMKLESLRKALIKEIRVSRYRRSSVHSPGNKSNSGDYSVDTYKKVRGGVEDHLQIVSELLKNIRQRLLNNVERFIELGSESPADLVMTFEIIEMHQEYSDRRAKQAKRKSGKDMFDTDDDVYESLVDDIDDRIKRIISEKVEGKFILAKEDAENSGESKVDALLSAATQIISMMTEFKNEVLPCIPPERDSLEVFLDVFEYFLVPEMTALATDDILSLQVSDFLQLIDWIEYYKAQMEGYNCSHRNSIKEFNQISENLKVQYLVRIRNQVMEWFDNIKKLPVETVLVNNKLITSQPEDMFNVIYQQLAVAKEKLPRDHLKDVVSCCIQVLREVQIQSFESFSNSLEHENVETICAIVNDNQRMQEKCDEFRDNWIPLVIQTDHREVLGTMLEDLSAEYLSLAIYAIDFLARSALGDLQDPVFSKLYTPEWERGGRLIPILTATLYDYFQDISKWLEEYYYAKFTRNVFDLTVSSYLMTLRKLSNGAFHFSNELVAAAIVLKDMQSLDEFFGEYADLLKQGGLKSTDEANPTGSAVADELRHLRHMAKIISATHISGATAEIKSLFTSYGGDGLKLVTCIILSNPAMSKNEKAAIIDKVEKMFEQGESQGVYSPALSEIFKTYDILEVAVKVQKKETKSSFWGRNK